MKLLRELAYSTKKDSEVPELPYDVYNDIENHIRNGAKDLEKTFANALELVKQAFDAEDIELPEPANKKQWKQFEELLIYSTKKLTKYRGIDGDWRMSSHIFHEMINAKKYKFVVEDNQGRVLESGVVSTQLTLPDLIQETATVLGDEYVLSPLLVEGATELRVSRLNIRQKFSVRFSRA